MALFSLLMAILVERLRLLPDLWQFDSLMQRYHKRLWDSESLGSTSGALLAMALPAMVLALCLYLLDGLFFGLFNLLVWIFISVICFSHQNLRDTFKKYIQAACRGDVQASFRYASELDCCECLDAVDEQDLGAKVGQISAWINYRYYGAVALFLIFLGPVGAVLYCTVRYYSQRELSLSNQLQRCQVAKQALAQQGIVESKLVRSDAVNDKAEDASYIEMPLVQEVQKLLDWIPSRIFSFGFVLSGQFSSGLIIWRKLSLQWHSRAKTLITETALASEASIVSEMMADDSLANSRSTTAPLSVRETLALLELSKRNFILLLTVLSVLTIFGVVN
ncbi:beta-lactamase regulator AmpE [Shewanella sp.]|uniref:beta-lactamase regulator AmpE n=1 Tax=Shewanella sp. TaxID=50422 RepID=UPI00405458C2